jgi:hypothetical protein
VTLLQVDEIRGAFVHLQQAICPLFLLSGFREAFQGYNCSHSLNLLHSLGHVLLRATQKKKHLFQAKRYPLI